MAGSKKKMGVLVTWRNFRRICYKYVNTLTVCELNDYVLLLCCITSRRIHEHTRAKLSCIQCIHFNFSLRHVARLHHVVVNRRVPIGWPTVTLSTQHRNVSMQRSKEVFQDRYYFSTHTKTPTQTDKFLLLLCKDTHTHTYTLFCAIVCTKIVLFVQSKIFRILFSIK